MGLAGQVEATWEHALGATAAPHYRAWEYALVAPHLGRRVLEAGAGMGHFSAELVRSGRDRLVLTDTDSNSVERLRTAYGDWPGVEVAQVRVPGPVNIGEPVDTVVAMNVLEHVGDDVRALRDLASALAPGGRVVLWTPAYMQLFGEFDRRVGHVRRYTPRTLRLTVEAAGLRVTMIRPVNLLGGVAWWVAVRQGAATSPRPALVWAYDNILVRASRTLERVVRPPFGQSVLCVAEAA